MTLPKKRLDLLLTERGLAPSREQAKAVIMSGQVYVNGQKEDKAGAAFLETAEITVKGSSLRYVSRGGLKLEKALQVFPVSPAGKLCLDVGASTGGFTDCMLQNGASHVISLDVGRGQLDWKLRSDARVTCMEKTNMRYLKPEDLPAKPAFVSCDVSFISLTKILPAMFAVMEAPADAVVLIKPQFEAGREKVGKKGVVRDPGVHRDVIRNVISFAKQTGFAIRALDFSPIRGPEGNIEYLLWMTKETEPVEESVSEENVIRIDHVVAAAHEMLI